MAVVATLLGAALLGAFFAFKTQQVAHAGGPSRRIRVPRGARTIAVPTRDRGVTPIATVIPPNAADTRLAWPPPLINPTANLRIGWDLALGRPNAHEILFTFDDGPNPGTTDRLLGLLDRAHIHAVFFVCGWRLETEEPLRTRARAILRDAFLRGHIIGNHTVHHRDMATLSPQQIRSEVDHNADLIYEVIGQRPHLFRPPYGSYSEFVREHIADRRDELMVWSIDSHDWQLVGNAQAVAMNVIRLIGNMAGGTVLLHDTHPWSVSAAQMVFRWIETENRERAAHGRPPYRVVDPAEYLEGERARMPMLLAERAAEEEAARHAGRHHTPDAGQGEETTSGNAGMGSGPPQ